MLKSMTGFGQAVRETEKYSASAEIKSLNSRGLDLNIRMPRTFSEKEITLRSQLANRLIRGKISLYIEFDYKDPSLQKKTLNRSLLENYLSELNEVASAYGTSTEGLLASLSTFPELWLNPDNESSEAEWQLVEQALEDAVQKFEKFRLAEGKALSAELNNYLDNIENTRQKIDAMKGNRLETLRTNLQEKLQQFIEDGQVDQTRLEQEMVYYAEKFDITEEIVRLQAHVQHFSETMSYDEAPGKKLNFIAQEMGREINTIGSKANDADIQKLVVFMKDELEKIKEQVLNIL